MSHSYPMMLDVAGRLIVIVGGGAVAVRKASGLIECGATRVRCVAPEIDPSMRKEVERIEARYEAAHLNGAELVFAATNDPDVNCAVVRDARARNILVSRADAGEEPPGDFITPARFHEGSVAVSVAAGSPALAAFIRNGIAQRWDPRWSRMAEAMQTLRPVIVARHDLHARRRQHIFRELATIEAMNVLGDGGVDALRTWLTAKFPELTHV
jgi:precorrin-2 dehydrogenase / sirohydrochlorin ferrochelatase